MDLKNFTAGQTAFLVGDGTYGSTQTQVQSVTVLSVGRKYVKVKIGARELQFYSNDPKGEYLCEKVPFGWPRYLFPTEQLASDWMEKKNLADWLKWAAENPPKGGYTLNQLRAIRKILEGKDYEN